MSSQTGTRAQPGPQPRRQRLSQAEHPVPEQPGARGPSRDPDAGQHGARMTRAQRQPAVIGLGDGHAVRGRQVGPAEVSQLAAEHPPVERYRLDAAPGGEPAGRLGVVVGVTGHPREAQRRHRQDQAEHVRAVLEQRLPQLGRNTVAGHVRQVGAGLLRAVGDPGVTQDRVARRPDPAARTGRRPAEGPGFLDDQDAQAEVRGGERGRHPGRPAARHHDVELRALGGLCRHAASASHTRTRYSSC